MSKKNSKLTMALILAGGRGSRLKHLTDERSKPALPFGKHYFVNFAFSNVVNSKIIDHAYVLTQYKQQGILDIIAALNFESPAWDKFIRPLPAQQQLSNDWYLGSANAVYQNHKRVAADPAQYVLILAADHIYKFDFEQLLDDHISHDADVTVSGMFLKIADAANNFGVMEVNERSEIKGFKEKPAHPKPHKGKTDECIISQGIYIFKKDVLLKLLEQDHLDPRSEHDFGKDILPKMVQEGYNVHFYDHGTNEIPNEDVRGYWRDVGTVDAYWEAMMDQTHFNPDLDLYNKHWPIITVGDNQPMAKFNAICCGCEDDERLQVIAAGGSVFTKAKTLRHSVLGREVRVEEGAEVRDSILLDRSIVGTGARITKTIVEEDIVIPVGCIIGESIEDDEERDIYISEGGIRIVHSKSKL